LIISISSAPTSWVTRWALALRRSFHSLKRLAVFGGPQHLRCSIAERRTRPHGRAAEQCDELAAFDSSNSSARMRITAPRF
jgi:hypothetical protein